MCVVDATSPQAGSMQWEICSDVHLCVLDSP